MLCRTVVARMILIIPHFDNTPFDNTPLPETEGPFEGDDDHQEIFHEPPSTRSGVTVRQKLICDVFS